MGQLWPKSSLSTTTTTNLPFTGPTPTPPQNILYIHKQRTTKDTLSLYVVVLILQTCSCKYSRKAPCDNRQRRHCNQRRKHPALESAPAAPTPAPSGQYHHGRHYGRQRRREQPMSNGEWRTLRVQTGCILQQTQTGVILKLRKVCGQFYARTMLTRKKKK